MTVVTEDVVAANLAERSLTLSDGRTLTGSHVVMAAGAVLTSSAFPVRSTRVSALLGGRRRAATWAPAAIAAAGHVR